MGISVEWEHYLFVVMLIMVIGVFVLINSQATPGFSKVYFDNATVPAYLTPNTTYNVIFIIESHEKSPKGYFFKVYLDDTVIKEGGILLDPGRAAQIPFEFSFNNVTYKKIVMWEQTTTYNLSGIYNITGNCMSVGIPTVNGSCTLCLIRYLSPSYAGPSNLSFLMDTSENVTITKIAENKSNTSTIVKEYQLTLLKLGEDRYRVIVRESKIMYLPKSVTIRVVVETADGKVYQIFKRFPLVEG